MRSIFTPERVVTMAITIVLMTTISLLLYVLLVPEPKKDSFGDYFSPQDILSRVDGVEGPAIRVGDKLVISGKRCVNKTTQLLSIRTWKRIDIDPPLTAQGGFQEPLVVEPTHGCIDTQIEVLQPVAVSAGTWQIQALDLAYVDGELRFWETTPFKVVNGPVER